MKTAEGWAGEIQNALGDHLSLAEELVIFRQFVERIRLEARTDGLFVPGIWICAKCGFTVHKNLWHVDSGKVAVNNSEQYEICPNDMEQMNRMTWQEWGEQTAAAFKTQVERAVKAEEELERLKK